MSSSTDLHTSTRLGGEILAVEPFTSLRFQFGMLLGVDDFEGLAANPRGKLRLHSAWLHKKGVVWGFGVRMNDRRELEVQPGLALDGRGRELHSEQAMCLDVGAWYQDAVAADRAPATRAEAGGAVAFDAHVVVSYRTCLRRPVPAVVEPCDGDGVDTTYSRVSETVELVLRRDAAPAANAAIDAYRHAAVALFLREADAASPTEVRIAAARDALRAGPNTAPEAWLALFREAAGLDRAALGPARPLPGTALEASSPHFPELEPADVVVAEVKNLRVRNDSADPASPRWLAVAPQPDLVISYANSPTLLPTSALQEVLVHLGVRP